MTHNHDKFTSIIAGDTRVPNLRNNKLAIVHKSHLSSDRDRLQLFFDRSAGAKCLSVFHFHSRSFELHFTANMPSDSKCPIVVVFRLISEGSALFPSSFIRFSLRARFYTTSDSWVVGLGTKV